MRPAISTPVFTLHNLICTVKKNLPADVIPISPKHARSNTSITMSLPPSRRFITQLLAALPPSAAHDASTNPLSALPSPAKKPLLALQVLFPAEFLPALDLLDRRLVVRLHAPDARTRDELETHTTPSNTVYYVSSAQPRRYTASYDTSTSYQVRLRAWNCSCPAFAFAAFPAALNEHPIRTCDPADEAEGAWFGGVSLGGDVPPVCKHLLACVLVERCGGLFGGCVVEREVSVEEAAGWAAGWGD